MFSRIRTTTLAAAAALLSIMLFAAPAAAHDQLVGSDPAADAQLIEAPTSIRLEYSAELLDLGETSTIVFVVEAEADENAKNWVAGVPEVDHHMLTVPLEAGMPAGAYEIRWQVVSSDGHQITGIVPFTIEGSAPQPEPVAETPEPVATPTESGPTDKSTPSAAPAVAEPEPMPQPIRIVLFGLGGAALAFALFFLSLRAIRHRKQLRG